METVPSPPALPRFKLPVVAWIAWGIFAAADVFIVVTRGAPLTPYAAGELIGGLVALLLFPALLSWVAWRVSDRKETPAIITFFVVFAVLVAGQLKQFRRKANPDAGAAIVQLANEQRRAREEGRPLDENKAAEQARDQISTMAENASGQEQLLAAGAKAYMDQLLAAKGRYDAAAGALKPDEFWDLGGLGDAKAIAERRTAVRAFAEANALIGSFQDENATRFRHELESRGVSSDALKQAVAGYKHSGGTRLPIMKKLRDTDAQFAQAMLDFLDFAETAQGKWRVDEATGKVVFSQDGLLPQYNAIMERVQTIGEEQEEYQKQLSAPKR